MRDDICTIPVSEVFEPKDGCPLCRMHDTVEKRITDYILGDAMMEPDVRIATNESGFCAEHYDKMAARRGRLQLALMLETHVQQVERDIFGKKWLNPVAKKAEKVQTLTDRCFICEKMEWGICRMTDTIYRLYETERDFRALFNEQPMFCLPHYEQLISGISKKNCPRYGGEMRENLTRITGEYLHSLAEDLSKYCKKYDYRSIGGEWGNEKNAVERSIGFLTGRNME